MAIPIIFDCDPGHDDAVALFIALANDAIEVKGITTCAGNQLPEKTFNNARKLLALAEREDITVCPGASKPLTRNLRIAADIHGDSGLDGAELPEPTTAAFKGKAWDFTADIIRNHPEPITLVATGPLTNVAIFLLAYPELKEKLERIIIMGGACFGGNITPAAEFNILVDPEAADIVFKSGVKVSMFGLDVTNRASMMPDEIKSLRNLGTKSGEIFADLLDFFITKATRYFLADEDWVEGVHLHDACCMAYIVDPSIFRMVDCHVEIDTNDGPTLGSTVVDFNGVTKKPANAEVAFKIDREKFIDLVIKSIAKFK